MGQLTDGNVRDIVRSELNGLSGDIRRELSQLERRIQDLHTIQTDIQRTIRDVEQMMSQTRNITNLSSVLSQLQLSLDEIRVRAKRSEESSRYTAGYVAMRLKERYDKKY